MPELHTQKNVQHSADDMFRLVRDVERYPEFVPLCTGLKILSEEATLTGTRLRARMDVGNSKLQDHFVTLVETDETARTIDVSYEEGPFEYLENRWRFTPCGLSACEVDFFISYEFRSRLMSLALGSVFEQAFRRFVQAFEDRADALYGTSQENSEQQPSA